MHRNDDLHLPRKKFRRIICDDDDDEQDTLTQSHIIKHADRDDERIIGSIKKQTTTIVTRTTKMVEENIQKVCDAVESGNKKGEGKLDALVELGEKTSNRILDKNDKQAQIIAKMHKDKEYLQNQLNAAHHIIANKGLGNARVQTRIMVIESTVGDNKDSLESLTQKHDFLRAEVAEIKKNQQTLQAKVMEIRGNQHDLCTKVTEIQEKQEALSTDLAAIKEDQKAFCTEMTGMLKTIIAAVNPAQ